VNIANETMNSPRVLPIIVLTPVRNEAWILERFIATTLLFADWIIIADQNSEDESREICRRFDRVILIENNNPEYNENSRSQLLVGEARKRFPGEKILLGIDADEIMSADGLDSPAWQTIRACKAGTVIRFHKPEITYTWEHYIEPDYMFPLGYADDGLEHVGRFIHSGRVPTRVGSPNLFVQGIHFMHLNRIRRSEYASRQAMYLALEASNRSKSYRIRNCYYHPLFFNYIRPDLLKPLPESWLAGWKSRGVDLSSFHSSRYTSYHLRVLELFKKHGAEFFHWESVWDEDWEKARLHFSASGYSSLIPAAPIKRPSALVLKLCGILLWLFYLQGINLAALRRKLRTPAWRSWYN
jgi:glycosyltransferase involved in cell wall biosynthesis